MEVRRGARRLGWEGAAGKRLRVPVLVLTRALLLRVVGGVSTVSAGVGSAVERLRQGVELLRDDVDVVAVDVDDAVAIAFFAVFVDEAAGEDARHVGLVEALGFGEGARVGDAAVFREAGSMLACVLALSVRDYLLQRQAVVAVLLDEHIPAGSRERRWIAPLVVVDGVEVTSRWRRATIQILGHVVLILRNIGRGIANRNLTVSSLANILLHITRHSLDIRCSIGRVGRVDHLVAAEEGEGI